MLQFIRSKATSLAAKLLFGVLIIAFGGGLWSNAGDMFRSRLGDTSVAHVGGRKIEPNEYRKEVQARAEQLRERSGSSEPLTAQQIKDYVAEDALKALIEQNLLELETSHLNLAIGDDQLRQTIRNVPAFHNERGVFDPMMYRAFLNQKNMSPQQFETSLRKEVVESQLDRALVAGVRPPEALVDALYRSAAERRTADIVPIPASSVPAPAAPNDADIGAYYEKHKAEASLSVPELRSFRVALLLADDVAAQIKVSDDDLRKAYDDRIDEFRTPAEGHFEQMVLPDEATAKQAAAALAEGKDFAQVAADVAHQGKDKIDLGDFKKGELLPALNEPAFALKPGETTAPIQSSFGWHILRAVTMKPEVTKPFVEVKAQIAKEVALERAGNEINGTIVNKITDALASGSASLEDIATKFDLKLVTVENVDAKDEDADGKAVALPGGADGPKILDAAFKRGVEAPSSVDDLGDGNFYVLEVTKVAPPAPRPLEAVKAKITEVLQQQARDAALQALAKEITDAVNGGQALAKVAEEHKLTVTTSPPLGRRGDGKTSPLLVAQIFKAKPGTTVFARATDGYDVAQVKEILPPDAAQQEKQIGDFASKLVTPAMQQDILEEFGDALHQRYPVTINTETVDALTRAD